MNSSSTLVATVSINYEDFTEGFLTCGTCLCGYDQNEHAPKLLSCSHTICQSCLELIASSPTLNNSTEAGCIKCPICRQNIAIPSGGISALPPSFLVNQLYDLVNKKPREFIPKCSVHIEQELLFCETCDCVFCDTCNNNNESDDSLTTSLTTTLSTTATATTISSSSSTTTNSQLNTNPTNISIGNKQRNNKQHINEVCTVIPFSTAIKRMSEILNYRSQQCLNKLDEAKENVEGEIDRLESNCSDALRDAELAFERIKQIVEDREKQLLEETKKLHEYKKNVLLDQLRAIENEKSSLNTNNSVKINNETDVKNLSKKISDLSEKNDTALSLFTPRENCFICFENENEEALGNIKEFINDYGKIRTSKTYPPFCTSKLLQYSTHLRSTALVQSIDYEGSCQRFGGDPIQAELKLADCNHDIDGEIEITDKHDGTYEVSFVPPVPGKYQLFIYIFNRPIKDCPLIFETNCHHNPVAIFGKSSKKGIQDQFDHFYQPASLTINKHNGRVYVLDSFNSRIKVLAQIDSKECPFSFMQHIQPSFFGRSCTGIALLYPEEDEECDEHGIQNLSLSPTKPPNPSILVTDWRNHVIYELNCDGKLLRKYSHEEMEEPTNIVVDSRGRIFVVDRESIFVFNSTRKMIMRLTGYKIGKESIYQQQLIDCDNLYSKKTQLLYADSQKLSQQTSVNMATNDYLSERDSQNKIIVNTATLNSNYSTPNNNNNISEKRSNAKTNTLSSLISIKRKPKIIPNSSLQRGSKAVMSAASRIRSTFTLSHSTSLVSAASLQSMFNNNNKHNTVNINHHNHHQQQQFDSQSVNINDNSTSDNNTNSNGPIMKQKQTSKNQAQLNNNVPIVESPINRHNALITSNEHKVTNDISETNGKNISNNGRNADDVDADVDVVEPFGIIRGIAIGPDDDLIVADESRIRVLAPSDNYKLKRELKLQNRAMGHHHHFQASGSTDRLCGMTYDPQSKKLLILYTNFNTGNPYIQIVDYSSGRAKFAIDSYESRLIRPSSLATYGQYVIVSDLGNDCIKKYRFY